MTKNFCDLCERYIPSTEDASEVHIMKGAARGDFQAAHICYAHVCDKCIARLHNIYLADRPTAGELLGQ